MRISSMLLVFSAVLAGAGIAQLPRNEGDIAGEAFSLATTTDTSPGELWPALRPSIERVGALAGFYLGEFGEQGDAFGLGKACDSGSLSL